MALTPKKLRKLRQAPVGPAGNRVALAIKLSEQKQGTVATHLALTQSYLSNVCRGRFKDITVANASMFAEYFGCAIEDLWPNKTAVAS